jgi:high affinity sulfate transporter 1
MSDGGKESVDGTISSRKGLHHGTDTVYKVGYPPMKGLLTEFSDTVKETFFANNPLREYKDQPWSKKLWLSLQHIFPVLDWGRHYTFSMFKGDFVAGLTIASLCIPQVISELSNRSPAHQ